MDNVTAYAALFALGMLAPATFLCAGMTAARFIMRDVE